MASVFISYRREDSAGWTGRLANALRKSLGARHVFMDIDTLRPGVDYKQVIERQLASSDIALVVIGPHWLTMSDKDGRRRLDDPHDLARLEVAASLRRGIPVVPVLVGGAAMPSAEELPGDLQSLACRNAYEISDRRWNYDQDRLIVLLRGDGYLKRTRFLRRAPIYLLGALLLASVTVGTFLYNRSTGPERSNVDVYANSVAVPPPPLAELSNVGVRPPTITASPSPPAKQASTRPFYIVGEVKKPGSYSYQSDMTVLDAVAIAGGFTDRARKGRFLLQRVGSSSRTVITSGDQALLPGDSLTIQEKPSPTRAVDALPPNGKCKDILAKTQLGEPLSDADRAILRKDCAS